MNPCDEMPIRQLANLSREELYEKVWSMPGSKLAEEFGLSDVAIAKRCKKLNVPRPGRGYWAKIQAGRKARRDPLPPTKEEAFARLARKKPARKELPPADDASLTALAGEFLAALKKCKNRWDKRIHLKEPSLPEATVSPALVERCAQAFHVILLGTGSVGIFFRKSRSSYDGGNFRMGRDQLFFEIEEELGTAPERAAGRGRKPIYTAYGDNRVPCGRLTFKIKDSRYGSQMRKEWCEGKDGNLENILVQVVAGIRHYFVEAQAKRAQQAIDEERRHLEWEEHRRKYQREQATKAERDRRHRHAVAVRRLIRQRRQELIIAAEWWRLHQVVQEYIKDCELKWMALQEGQLNSDQTRWLLWAKEAAAELSPSAGGYPDPALDGPLDLGAIPLGGPYPRMHDFTQPPTMPKIPKSESTADIVRNHY